MKHGRIVVWDKIKDRFAAALLIDGVLQDLLIDPKDDRPITGSIYRAKVGQAMKGQGGAILDLGQGQKGYLRGAKGLSAGDYLTVQVASYAEAGKAAPVSQKVIFKSRFAIVTPGAPGLNVARAIREDEERDRLQEIAHEAMEKAPDDFGLILRSACLRQDADAITQDIEDMLTTATAVHQDKSHEAGLLIAATAHSLSVELWSSADQSELVAEDGSFDTMGIWDHIETFQFAANPLPNSASFYVEPTRALVAVDVNTGADFSLMAGNKANLATAKALPRALRLRGLGGQIVLDLAPMAKKDRRIFEQVLRSAFKQDSIDTALVGWTPLGHYELQRKRERLPLTEVL